MAVDRCRATLVAAAPASLPEETYHLTQWPSAVHQMFVVSEALVEPVAVAALLPVASNPWAVDASRAA